VLVAELEHAYAEELHGPVRIGGRMYDALRSASRARGVEPEAWVVCTGARWLRKGRRAQELFEFHFRRSERSDWPRDDDLLDFVIGLGQRQIQCRQQRRRDERHLRARMPEAIGVIIAG